MNSQNVKKKKLSIFIHFLIFKTGPIKQKQGIFFLLKLLHLRVKKTQPRTSPVSDRLSNYWTFESHFFHTNTNELVCHTRGISAPSISLTFFLIVQVFGSAATLFCTCHLIFRVTAENVKVLHPELHVGNSFWQAT